MGFLQPLKDSLGNESGLKNVVIFCFGDMLLEQQPLNWNAHTEESVLRVLHLLITVVCSVALGAGMNFNSDAWYRLFPKNTDILQEESGRVWQLIP